MIETTKTTFSRVRVYEQFWCDGTRYIKMPCGTVYKIGVGQTPYNALRIAEDKEEYVYITASTEVECGIAVL